jgi:putative flavoprotein involved in K+ transport
VQEVGTVVVGAGQAGLAIGYHLARHHQDFVILEASTAIGESWRKRWNSLRLFTPIGFTHLPGLQFPGKRGDSPGKDDVADYLASYAEYFALPVTLGTRVEAVLRDGESFTIVAGRDRWNARNVVLASGSHVGP